jgi:hypothetical protein
MNNNKFIDVEKILRQKAIKLYKWLPRFALNWLKKKLHEDEINSAMLYLESYEGLEFNSEGLKLLGASVESVNGHFIPKTGRVTVASNHPKAVWMVWL